MNRRKYLKTLALGSVIPTLTPALPKGIFSWGAPQKIDFTSEWQQWPNMKWIGPEYWSNPLQDWELIDGKPTCMVSAANRNIQLLTIQKQRDLTAFEVAVDLQIHNLENLKCAGLILGAKGPFDDYRSAAVFGKGLNIGLNSKSELVVGDKQFPIGTTSLKDQVTLKLSAVPTTKDYTLKITLIAGNEAKTTHEIPRISPDQLAGNFALEADYDTKGVNQTKSVAFSNWRISSSKLLANNNKVFGPICFAQYTLNKGHLKITAQCSPIESISGQKISFQIQNNNQWKNLASTSVPAESRATNFSINNWEKTEDTPYRMLMELPLKDGIKVFTYEGTIAKEPLSQEEIKTAVFSCNFHHGFPDQDIPDNVGKLNPDIVLFLGDQFYEGTGGYGPLFSGAFDKLCLDYLRKWYMFGWSYRELFRHKPCAIIPDDHDVYHGNVWGEGGKQADMSNGVYAPAQDSGGYKMPAEWVNMIQFTQTSHLPDPFDPTPVKQNIGVYYTHWNYAGLSFAILEDRKFKSAPKNVLPPEAEVWNGWIMGDNFDIKAHRNIKAELLGERQHQFLDNWVKDWSNSASMKVVLSQTNFATVATLPKSEKNDANVPSMPIPEKGEYVKGDSPTADMDSNGWPAAQRDIAVAKIRKGFAFHIAGDQHLASFVQYGLEEHGDSGHAFAGPALNNIWPRRFWPEVDSSNHSYENPAYTGNHYDGFGNKMTVKAVANPYNTGKTPEIIHNRSTGFGLVTFNKTKRTIKTECWPRFVDPVKHPELQYAGWPVTIKQEDNFAKSAKSWLPTIKISSKQLPVLQVFERNELVYAIRLKEKSFQPKTFNEGAFDVKLINTETGDEKLFSGLAARKENREVIEVEI